MQLTEPLENAYKLGSETSAAIAQRVLRGLEDFNELQFAVCRGWLQESAAQVQSKAAESFSPAAAFPVPSFEKQFGYLQGVQKLAAELQHDLITIIDEKQKALSRQASQVFQEVRANTPPGSEAALVTVESLLNATNHAFEQAARFSERITQLVANHTAAADADTGKAGAAASRRAA